MLFTLETFAKEFKSYQPKNKRISFEKNLNYKKISSLKWQKIENTRNIPLDWEIIDNKTLDSTIQNLVKQKFKKKEIKINSLDRNVVVNNIHYPEISHYVPNGYVSYSEKFVTTNLRTISKLRFCDGKNFEYKCADGILNIDLNLINNEKFSFNTRFSMQSISNRGTKFGEESSLGFKLAKNISPNWSIAFGGENIIHLDKDIDLGRNFYLIGSTFKKLGSSNKNNPSLLFLNIGIGSDFYGYKGNGFLWRTPCLGKPNLTGDINNNCSWGPIGSIAIAPNDRLTFISEWFGYSYGSGFSIKPFKDKNLTLSLLATDFIKGFPKYAIEHCPNNECETRFYGNISLSF
ncbi:MAG: hypothetical protein JJ845_001660 [Prochlorococcus marinus CUG1436]|nr:hypothetical protein [Prochlorococcus marinus CUG1436]